MQGYTEPGWFQMYGLVNHWVLDESASGSRLGVLQRPPDKYDYLSRVIWNV
jgi:hypothetical protein